MSHITYEVAPNGVATVLFNRPEARNAMTWAMYQDLERICQDIQASPHVRVLVLKGAGGKAFVAGTDIEQFSSFKSGADGIAYERKIDAYVGGLASLPIPTLAVINGWTIGGGLALAAACDFRIATPHSQFGVPIAKTLGNCLSASNLSMLKQAFGVQRLKRMLMLAQNIGAPEAYACGFLHAVAEADELDLQAQSLIDQLLGLAPITLRVSKMGIRQLSSVDTEGFDALIEMAYGSQDFAEGVNAFVNKRPPCWKGC